MVLSRERFAFRLIDDAFGLELNLERGLEN
jgi:hypothetical protein